MVGTPDKTTFFAQLVLSLSIQPLYLYLQIFIKNEFVDSVSGRNFPNISPITGKKFCGVSEGDKVRRNTEEQLSLISVNNYH
jgi:hypothetical protein